MKNIAPPPVNCEGKHRFANRGMASQVATKTNRTRDRRMNVYRCPHCEGWHLGEHVRRSIKKERAA